MKFLCISSLTVLSWLQMCMSFSVNTAFSQVNIDSVKLPADVDEDDVDSVRLQIAIDLASEEATKRGLTGAVFIPAGDLIDDPDSGSQRYVARKYDLNRTIMVRGNVLLVSDSQGRRGARLTWNKGLNDGEALLHFDDGFGGGINGLELGVSQDLSQVKGIVGLQVDSQSSAVFQNFTVNMQAAGPDSVGIRCGASPDSRNTESVMVRDFDVRAARPVMIGSGDNITFSNFDITCLGSVTVGNIKAVFQNEGSYVPANLVIGPGSGQKGDHAICFVGRRERTRGTGDSMTVQNFRWEQGSSRGPAWLIDIFRFAIEQPEQRLHAIESLVMINCRNSPKGSQNPHYVSRKIPAAGVLKAEFIGGYLPGKYLKD